MQLLIDGGNLSSRCLFSKDVTDANGTVDYHTWKYAIFNSILSTFYKFKNTTEIIIAVDSPHVWRKMVYPLYKGNRKKDEKIDWEEFFNMQQEFFKECAENLPFKFLKVKNTEADDIIGILGTKNRLENRETVIISTDCDFIQVADGGLIKLWNPLKKEYTDIIDKEYFLQEASLTGQGRKDNIYNVITPLDWDLSKRMPGLGPKKAQKIIEGGLEEWLKDNNAEDAYKRNRILIDLDKIPEILKNRILDTYMRYSLPSADKITDWLSNCGWRAVEDDMLNIENKLLTLY